MRLVKAIVAVEKNRGIGLKGDLPWHIPADLKWFANQTKAQSVLMGRNTWDSLKAPYKPLPGRQNIVCSRNIENIIDESNSVLKFSDPIKVISDFREGLIPNSTDTLWVVGGAQIYTQTLNLLDELYLTQIEASYECDAFFPEYENYFTLVSSEAYLPSEQPNGTLIPGFAFNIYKKI